MRNVFKLLCALLVLCTSLAQAEGFRPERPVTLVVGYSPGGSNDKVAREIAHRLNKIWGQAVVVENKAGASGAIAAADVERAAPDGLRLLVGPVTLTMLPAVQENLPYDLENGLTPIGMIGQSPIALVVSDKLDADDLESFLALAKSESLFLGTTGIGAVDHFGGLLLMEETGISMEDVSYRGGSELLMDLMENRVNMSMSALTLVAPHVRAGRLKALAVTGEKRSPVLPDVPHFSEYGINVSDVVQWWGLFAPKDTPRNIVDSINADLNGVLQDPGLKQAFATEASVPTPMAVEEFAEYISQQQLTWDHLFKRTEKAKN